MADLLKVCSFGGMLAGLLIGGASTIEAAGAIAVGRCDRHGYAYDYSAMSGARARAMAECAENGDTTCEVVVTFNGACGAFAVDGDCGARGWGWAQNRRGAERIALAQCAKFGGAACTIRRWVCESQ